MRILHITPTYYPATYWGGPIFSVYALNNALAVLPSIELKVLTTDAAGPQVSNRLKPQELDNLYSDYDVIFCRRVTGACVSAELLRRLLPLIRWADVLHLTGTYSFPTIPTLAACRLLGKPLVWSLRGALQATEEWKGAKKRKPKKVWELICNAVMPKRCVLHVTSENERAASLGRLPNAVAAIIPNGTDIPESLSARRWRPGGVLRLLFLGRLDPKKGIENLFEALTQIDHDIVALDVYGSGKPSYSRKLLALANELGLDSRVRFHGHVNGEDKTRAFMEADMCVVPSYTENFGMVVAEALAHGVPVIASRGTPWAELESRECGLWVENTPNALAAAIRAMRSRDLRTMGKRGREWMQDQFRWDSVAGRMSQVYRVLICSTT